MLEERHNFKAWLYLSPALVLLLIFTFYPIFNSFNLLFMYNYDYMQGERDGYTFYQHDPVRAERWAYREHWNTVTDLAISPDGFVYSSSNSVSLHRTNLRGVMTGDYLSLDPQKVLTVADVIDDTGYSTDDISTFFVDGASRVYVGIHDPITDEHIIVYYTFSFGVWTKQPAIVTPLTDSITTIVASNHLNIYAGAADGSVIKMSAENINALWIKNDHTGAINALALEGNFIYTASADHDVRKMSTSNGDTIWSYAHADEVTGVDVDIRGSVYSSSLDQTIISVNADGVERYVYTHDTALLMADVDRNRQVYAATQNGEIIMLSENGELSRTIETEDTIGMLIVDRETRSNVYVAFDDGRIAKYDYDDNLEWLYTRHEQPVLGIVIDNNNRVFSMAKDGMIYRAEQLRVFTNFESPIHSIVADNGGDIYAGLENGHVVRIQNNTDVVWTYQGHTDSVTSIAVDAEGYVYSVSESGSVHKINAEGTIVWTYDGHTGPVWDVAVDSSGHVYTAGQDGSVRKIDSQGSLVWSYNDHTERVNGVDVDTDGYVYSASSDKTVHKISSTGSNIWVFDEHNDVVNDVVVDSQGRIYSVSDDETMRRITPNGNEFWVYTRFSRSDINTIRIKTVTLDDDDNIYFGTQGDGSVVPTVRRVNEATRVSIFHNFINTVQSDMFFRALMNTFIIVFVSVPVSVIIALLLSVWLNSIKKLQGFFQTVFFLPYVTNAIAIGMAFAVIFNRDYGLINYILTQVFGMSEGLNWLGRVSVDDSASGFVRFTKQYLNLPMLSLMVFIIWGSLAFKIMVFLSGLQSIDKQYYDAARVDATPKSRVFRRITIPLLSPMIAYITITSFIGAFKEYTAIVGMFGPNLGPPGDPDRLITIVGLVYKSLNEMGVPGRLSEAAATAIILFFMTLVLTLFNMYVSKKRVHY